MDGWFVYGKRLGKKMPSHGWNNIGHFILRFAWGGWKQNKRHIPPMVGQPWFTMVESVKITLNKHKHMLRVSFTAHENSGVNVKV